ncbi:apolipoprotein L3-like isoform X2 [Mustelus asterias]
MKGNADIEDFKKNFLCYQKKMTESSRELVTIADEIDDFHKTATYANVTGSSIGIAGGILSIAGLIAAPFTLGTSLALTGVGVGLGVAGGATNIAATATESATQTQKQERVAKIQEEYQNESKIMADSLQKVSRRIQSWIQGNEGDLAKDVFIRTSGTLSKSLTVVSSVASAVTKKSLTLFKSVSGVLSAFFIAWDIYSVMTDAKDLASGSKTEVAAKIREAAEIIEQEVQEYEKVYNELMKL